ncbi:clarin-3-like [Harmonia axyridis]|uniref:clarin-3-like n=1 Tax=Harmonia axyridis TaxID=115357 RepID=UPI001E278E13|nr:clarin-3-like [Harmonia axyridis]
MVQFKRSWVLSTCFLSGAASIISFVSLFTQGWINFDGRFSSQGDSDNTLSTFNYGLFGGTYYQRYGSEIAVDITMTCAYSHNICALLCAKNSDMRSKLLDDLYDGTLTSWNVRECPQTTSLTVLREKEMKVRTARLIYDSKEERIFLNAYAYLFTVIFLIISCLLGVFSAGISVWNTASNPIEVYFNIFGLYIYNGVAFGSLLIAVMIWGIMFCSTLADHPGFILSIMGTLLTDGVSLGWSYWINMASLLLYATSIGLLYFRSVLLSREPQLKVEIEDNAPAGILLF